MEGAQRQAREGAATAGALARSPRRSVGDLAATGALKAAWAALSACSPATARSFLEGAAAVVGAVDARHRRVVEDNLARAFPDMDPLVRAGVVGAAFRNWGRLVAEVVHCDHHLAAARERSEWTAVAAAVEEAQADGRGVLLLTAHLGNFEMLARCFGTLVAPVAVFHRPLATTGVDDFLVAGRLARGVTTLGRGAAVRDAMRVLAGGGSVALPLDQNQREGRGIFVDVLGHPASTSTVLARLSLVTGAPVLPVFATWQGEAIVPVFSDWIRPPRVAASDRDAWIRRLTVAYSAEIDRMVRRFPHQWNWAHRRWKTRPGAGEVVVGTAG